MGLCDSSNSSVVNCIRNWCEDNFCVLNFSSKYTSYAYAHSSKAFSFTRPLHSCTNRCSLCSMFSLLFSFLSEMGSSDGENVDDFICRMWNVYCTLSYYSTPYSFGRVRYLAFPFQVISLALILISDSMDSKLGDGPYHFMYLELLESFGHLSLLQRSTHHLKSIQPSQKKSYISSVTKVGFLSSFLNLLGSR